MRIGAAVALFCLLAVAAGPTEAKPEPGLAAALKAHGLELIALDVRPAQPSKGVSTRSRHAGTVKVAVVSKGPLSQAKVQRAAEAIRQAIEPWKLPHLFGVSTYFYASYSVLPYSISGGYPAVPWGPKALDARGDVHPTLNTVDPATGDLERMTLSRAVDWYARSICFRPYETDRMKKNAFLQVHPWQRVDLWCDAHTKKPRKGVAVVARPRVVASEVEVLPSAEGAGAPLLADDAARLVTLRVAGVRPRTGLVVRSAHLFLVTDGRPLDRAQFARLAQSVREKVERWAIPALGAVNVEVYEPVRSVDRNGYVTLETSFRQDPEHTRNVRYALTGHFPKPDTPVPWYGKWIWHRALDYTTTRSGEFRFRGFRSWRQLGWWAARNALPPTDPASVALHAPVLVKGRLPETGRRGRR